jgi:serine/threonine protein kinase
VVIDSLVGRTLGPYVLQEPIGYGAMAVVYRGYQPSLGRPVAVKVFAPIASSDPSLPARFRREARLGANLMHPNIVPVYDFGEWDGRLCIVMALITGGTLKERIQGPLPVSVATLLVGQVADALAYAHGRGILHRDVKPANVMLAAFDWAMLGDFGIARALGETTPLTGPIAPLGTPTYMAPEQCLGEEVDRRTDIYSLGVVLYELLAGVPPFTAEMPRAMMRAHLERSVPPLSVHRSDVPAGLENVIQRALAKDPADRFRHAGEFKAALEAATSPPMRPRPPGGPSATPLPVSYMVPSGRPSVEPDDLASSDRAPAPAPESTVVAPTVATAVREPSAPTAVPQALASSPPLPRPPIDRPAPRTNRPNRRRSPVVIPIAIVGVALLLVTVLATAAGFLVATGGDEVAKATPTDAPIAGVGGRPSDPAPTVAAPTVAPPAAAPASQSAAPTPTAAPSLPTPIPAPPVAAQKPQAPQPTPIPSSAPKPAAPPPAATGDARLAEVERRIDDFFAALNDGDYARAQAVCCTAAWRARYPLETWQANFRGVTDLRYATPIRYVSVEPDRIVADVDYTFRSGGMNRALTVRWRFEPVDGEWRAELAEATARDR